MKFRVIGANKDTGARMVLEFEAESKGAAERKALQQGMSVNRVEDISEGSVGHASDPSETARRARTGMHPIVKTIIFVVILVVAWYVWSHRGTLFH